MKSRNGLLPIQNECAYQLRQIRRKQNVMLFPNPAAIDSFLNHRKEIAAYAREEIDKAQQKHASIDLASARVHVTFFCEKLTSEDVDVDLLQTLYDDSINELQGNFFNDGMSCMRWSAFLINVAQNDALTAHIIASSFAYAQFKTENTEILGDIAINLFFVSEMLLSTSFEEQISLASYDLAIEQASINRSLKRITVISTCVAILAFIISVASLTMPYLAQA